MVETTPATHDAWRARGRRSSRGPLALAALLLSLASGCVNPLQLPDSWLPWGQSSEKYKANTLPEDSVILTSDGLRHEEPVDVIGGDYEGARRMFEEKKYAAAEPIFCRIADSNKNIMQIQESARFYQAECNYKLGQFPRAGDCYVRLLDSFPSAAHGGDARKRMYDIANYWLDETRDQMETSRAIQDGKASWMESTLASMHLYPWSLRIHFEDSKPAFDMEGHARRLLEKIYITDPRGEMGEKALFMLASVEFYRERWRDADNYFYQLVQNYPNSPHAAKALQLSLVCKVISVAGPEYDPRKLQEARDLIQVAKRSYPELVKSQETFLTKQLVAIHLVDAERDFGIAQFYERTGHPGSAHFYYEIVKRRYSGTEFAEKAEKRIVELRARAVQETNKGGTPAASDTGAAAPADSGVPQVLPPSITQGKR
jgi:outer membrane protein assembly factor BamD (BamD/ComL family)